VFTITAGSGYGIGTPARATGAILDDDSAGVTNGDVTALEGQSGATGFVFSDTLTNTVDTAGLVPHETADDSATEVDNDYNGTSGGVNFSGAAEAVPVTVTVNGDVKVEPDEIFYLVLNSVFADGRNVSLDRSQGTGTIRNDDFADVTVA